MGQITLGRTTLKGLLALKAKIELLLPTVLVLLGTSACCGVLFCVPPPGAPCEIETLLVDESVFPRGWEQQGLPSSEQATISFGVEKRGTGFSTRTRGVAVQDVYRAFNARAAATGYRDFRSLFSVRKEETEWTLPAELTYRSQVADQYRLACSTHRPSGVERCQFVGQYRMYLVSFHTYMSTQMMTYDDFEHILQDIDQRMAKCLN